MYVCEDILDDQGAGNRRRIDPLLVAVQDLQGLDAWFLPENSEDLVVDVELVADDHTVAAMSSPPSCNRCQAAKTVKVSICSLCMRTNADNSFVHRASLRWIVDHTHKCSRVASLSISNCQRSSDYMHAITVHLGLEEIHGLFQGLGKERKDGVS